MNDTLVQTRIPRAAARWLKRFAARESISVADVLRRLIAERWRQDLAANPEAQS